MTNIGTQDDVSRAVLDALAQRSASATVCPSEVAKSLASTGSTPEGWRNLMPIVHSAVDELLGREAIKLSWKGKPMPARSGPYRISRATSDRD
ncbi:DUF3253 domain-containing protein [Sphingobium yanoikuyae]|uniref:DUF3253 domain-containing protein n=1 Tax=Sphingobium yanoikuyae TaxID=13690 RepID=A0A430BFM5_SPHYA|nr:DUF3253 domain-containing protein [Sphingobium yanoikuyae]RSU48379.1 DUF3253 domain-containing protein [Sphingobium yanoikuyae]